MGKALGRVSVTTIYGVFLSRFIKSNFQQKLSITTLTITRKIKYWKHTGKKCKLVAFLKKNVPRNKKRSKKKVPRNTNL